MPSAAVAVVAVCALALRSSAYIFLRWIPGDHFPPIVIASLVIYLIWIAARPKDFTQSWLTSAKSSTSKPAPSPDPSSSHEKKEPEPLDAGARFLQPNPDEVTGSKTSPAVDVLTILISGVPNWKLKGWSYATIASNVLLAIFTLEFVLHGPFLYPSEDLRFSRVGYVDSNSAKVLFREPDVAQLPVYAYHQKTGSRGWTTGDKIYHLSSETDFTYPITFTHLQPSTSYSYALSNNLSGIFTTAPSPSSPAAGKLTFLTSSCIKAHFPYNPYSHPLSIVGFTYLSSILQLLPSPPSFLLFLGDFIYVDVPLRLASTAQHYRSEYRRVYASPSWSLPGISSLPWLHTLDDHEIANDWAEGNTTDPFPAAQDPFLHYHVSVNPPRPLDGPSSTAVAENTTYFSFTQGPASFFMLDTRAYRTAPEPSPNATILGAAQLSSLLTYLRSPEPPGVYWKMVASSVPFTKNWRFGTSDTWGGFLAERAIVLEAMHTAEAELGVRVIILSGDRHEFGAVRFPPPSPPPPSSHHNPHDHRDDNRNTNTNLFSPSSPPPPTNPFSGPHEFSVGPLSMFYLPIRTFRQTDNVDITIKYLPDGNSKIGVVDISNLVSTTTKTKSSRGRFGVGEGEGLEQKSLLRYSLWVDGRVAWEYTLTSPGVEFRGREKGDELWR